MVDPQGAGRATYLIVGGGLRGVVCSASYEARQMGVRSAMPTARAVKLCPQALVVPVPFGACSAKSKEIRAALQHFSPVVQAASIDEWYVDLTGTEALYGYESLGDTAQRLRAEVKAATGLTVSVGAATNRLVAKLAVERAKPKPGTGATGVFVVPPGEEEEFLATVALADIPMIGPRFRTALEGAGLYTVPDVRAAGVARLTALFGERAAEWLTARVYGRDASDVRERDFAKSVSHEETFGHDLTRDEDLDRELVHLVDRVAYDMRRDGIMARTVTVKLRDKDFRTRGASRTVSAPVMADRPILATARELLAKLRRARRVPARLLGVALSGLTEADLDTQLSLFSDVASGETAKDRAVTAAVDKARAKFGRAALLPARLTTPSPAGRHTKR